LKRPRRDPRNAPRREPKGATRPDQRSGGRQEQRNTGRPEAKDLSRVAGLPAVAALFATAPERVERLFFDERLKGAASKFAAEMARARKPYRMVEGAELQRIAGSAMHGGIVALAQPKPVLVFDAEETFGWARDGKLLVLLDGVGNPQNLGAIARTVAFFGLPRLVLSDHPGQAGVSDASRRVAEGGLEHVEVYRAVRFAAAVKALRRAYRVVAAAPGPHRAIGALRAGDKPFALVLGNEEDGVPRATLDACDETVAIPGGGAVQSLNVAASAAILIHALALLSREKAD
jgi:TrmH RNA methyltransferase